MSDKLDIDKLEAGREMDALVAEKIFGYEWEQLDDDVALVEPEELSGGSNYFRTYWPNRDTKFRDSKMDVLPYSTDITAALPVAEKMIADGWGFSLIFYHSMGCWQAEFFTNARMGNADADTTPLAICRAALLAVKERL